MPTGRGQVEGRGGDVLDRSNRVLVAGAGGFIGGHLVAHLLDEGFTEVRAVDVKAPEDWFARTEGVPQRDTSSVGDVRWIFEIAGSRTIMVSNSATTRRTVIASQAPGSVGNPS